MIVWVWENEDEPGRSSGSGVEVEAKKAVSCLRKRLRSWSGKSCESGIGTAG